MFLAPSEGADAVRDTWVSMMWSLDKDDGKGAEEAVRRAHELVLKPQREGGGNNVYRGSIPPFVAQLPQQERVAWVAMELICPPRILFGLGQERDEQTWCVWLGIVWRE